MNKKPEILARLINPKPKGIPLYGDDLSTEDAVIQLFSACKDFKGSIYAKGWEFLNQRYGLEKLYQFDQKSSWFPSETKAIWLDSVFEWALISGYNLHSRHLGVYEKGRNLFITDDGAHEVVAR